jgi:hypothetical protein
MLVCHAKFVMGEVAMEQILSLLHIHFSHPSMPLGMCDNLVKTKGKAIPLQAWTGPEGSSSLRLPDFKTIGT